MTSARDAAEAPHSTTTLGVGLELDRLQGLPTSTGPSNPGPLTIRFQILWFLGGRFCDLSPFRQSWGAPNGPLVCMVMGSQQSWGRGKSRFLIQARSSKGRQWKNQGREPIRQARGMNNLHCPKVCGAGRLCCDPPLTSNAIIF